MDLPDPDSPTSASRSLPRVKLKFFTTREPG